MAYLRGAVASGAPAARRRPPAWSWVARGAPKRPAWSVERVGEEHSDWLRLYRRHSHPQWEHLENYSDVQCRVYSARRRDPTVWYHSHECNAQWLAGGSPLRS